MDLRSGYPYWFVKNGLLNSYPVLADDIDCDVAVVGGGITGALCAYYLQKAGAKVTVVDKRHIGLGSTCASTALLQYEIDISLSKLAGLVGEENAIKSYLLCGRAIKELKTISGKLARSCDFRNVPSIYFASYKKDVKEMETEFFLRKAAGIDIKFIKENKIKQLTINGGPAALYSKNGATMDAYRFTHGVFEYLLKRNCKIFDNTEVVKIKEQHQKAQLLCANGKTITCRKFVLASGYESLLHLRDKVATLHSTYAIASKPVHSRWLHKLRYVIWETARPYLYMRTTSDQRIIVGGKDEMFYSPLKRDKLIRRKSMELKKAFLKKYPGVPFEIDFAWAGTFAETRDALPYIGQHKRYKHAYFALGFGGNGIIFSQIAGEIIAELFSSGKSKNAHLFSFERIIRV